MAVDVKDLPPAYQAQALRKWAEQERKKGRKTVVPSPAAPTKAGKYHNRPDERVVEGGAVLRFDSQKEARRYDELCLLLEAGDIRDLRLQAQFTLQEAYTTAQGVRVRAIRYVADFAYKRKVVIGDPGGTRRSGPVGERTPSGTSELSSADGSEGYVAWVDEVEDVKSTATRTKTYVMKKKLMQERFGIEIQEV
jgi:hypothetical protein